MVENPTIVVEVLSRSTEEYDRGLKWEGCRKLPSLNDYLLVSQKAPGIEHYRSVPGDSWRYQAAGLGDTLTLSTGGPIDVSSIFDGVFELVGD